MKNLKNCKISLFLYSLFFIACTAPKPTEQKLAEMPYKISEASQKSVVVGEHYGVLNSQDIDIYAWQNDIGEAYGLEGSGSFWICFKKRSITKMTCREFGPDPDDHNINYSDLEFDIYENGVLHEVGGRRAWEYSVCKKQIMEWKKLLEGQTHFCIGGEHGRHWPGDNSNKHSWTYDKFKTKNGCANWFRGYCDPEYWRKCGGYPDKPWRAPTNKC